MRIARRAAIWLSLALTLTLGRPGWSQAGSETISLALQEGGTALWEIEAMRALHLDEANGIAIDLRPVADSRAAQVALQAGAVDAILSDFIWVSVQRHMGADFTFVPHSLAVGGLMVMPGGPVAQLADLKGRTLGVAGGPVDKSYLILQAWYAARTGGDLTRDASAKFGAPPLINEVLASGEVAAALNFWHFNARARVAGAVELVSVAEMLAGLGVTRQPPLLGWVFSGETARSRPEALRRFLDASFATKAALLTDDGLWETIRPAMKAGDDALFRELRDAYRAGIVTGYGDDDIAAAAQAYALMVRYGGADLVGDATELAPGTFWDGYRHRAE